MLAAIEAGGTKFVCGVGGASNSLERVVIPTRDVETTMAEVGSFLDRAIDRFGPLEAIGVGSFGPIDLDPDSPGYGRITTTPKPGWQGADLPGWLRRRFGRPVAIDTDVNAAALAEARLRGTSRLAYVTIGTGIGVGLVIEGRAVKGFGHPEAGHIHVSPHPDHAGFAGICPYHGDCLEGMASGPAIEAAWGQSLEGLAAGHSAWAVEAHYAGQLCASLILTLAIDHVVLGGGVMHQQRLIPMVRAATLARLGGYCAHWDEAAAEARISAPLSVEPPGLVGAYMLAEQASARTAGG